MTGFIQVRDGKVPKARPLDISIRQDSLLIQGEMAVWDLFSDSWLEDREKVAFDLDLYGRDLDSLVECYAMFGSQ